MAAPSSLPSSSSLLLISPFAVDSLSLNSLSLLDPVSSPLPLLPTELKQEILRFCDPATLVQTSLVSLEFLALSSPVLYFEVSFRNVSDLAKMFTKRDERSQPRLEPYLSLGLVKHLSYSSVLPPSSGMHKKLNALTMDRVPPPSSKSSTRRLSLTSLLLRIQKSGFALSPKSFYLFFNPLHVTIEALPSNRSGGAEFSLPSSFPVVKDVLPRWTRLRSFTMREVTTTQRLANTFFKQAEFEVIHDLSQRSSEGSWRRGWEQVFVEGIWREEYRQTKGLETLQWKMKVLVGTEAERIEVLDELERKFRAVVAREDW